MSTPKIGVGFTPQNGWFIINGSKPYFLMDDLRVFPLFLETPDDVFVVFFGDHDFFSLKSNGKTMDSWNPKSWVCGWFR